MCIKNASNQPDPDELKRAIKAVKATMDELEMPEEDQKDILFYLERLAYDGVPIPGIPDPKKTGEAMIKALESFKNQSP